MSVDTGTNNAPSNSSTNTNVNALANSYQNKREITTAPTLDFPPAATADSPPSCHLPFTPSLDDFTKQYASFYQYLQYKQLVPSSTIEDIVKQMKHLRQLEILYSKALLKKILVEKFNEDNVIADALKQHFDLEPFSLIHDQALFIQTICVRSILLKMLSMFLHFPYHCPIQILHLLKMKISIIYQSNSLLFHC